MGAPSAVLPWRGPGPDRPRLPLPPGSMPMLGPGRRLRKRWRYHGVFCEQFMLCAARVEVGPAGQTFWAILDRSTGRMEERTRRRLPGGRRGEVWSELARGGPWALGSDEAGVVTRIDAGEVSATLRVGQGRWAESVCPTREGGYTWTRKRVAPVACRLTLPGGRRIEAEARGVEDESAGYHPRHTAWSWSAGVGTVVDGREIGWNLVSGINDPPRRSERTIWVSGEPSEPGPVRFEPDLSRVELEDGSRLDFEPEAERSASENLLLLRSSYRQPFGIFTGSLAGLRLERGWGVMERHDAVW